MKATIDVDVGGTFTDCFALFDGRVATGKAPTTRQQLGLGCIQAISVVADSLGLSMAELMKQTEVVRLSSTIATNALIQRTGPTLGLITTEGFEGTVEIGRGGRWIDGLSIREARDVARQSKPKPVIPLEMTVGIKERIDARGEIVRPLDEDDVREKVRHLLNKGARGFVVALLWSYLNPVHERRVKDIIEAEFLGSYLGSDMSVMLSSEVCPKRWEYTRTTTTMLNAYLHSFCQEGLANLVDELRGQGYEKVVMLVHNTGGMAEIFRSTAIQTCHAGPVAGLIGSAGMARTLGYDNVISTDMGGTSFDLGIIVGGSTRSYQWRPLLDRWQVDMVMLRVDTIGAGGGSIAWLNPALGNRLEVGPHSAGSEPGPACYGRGGTEPAVTDADVVLGYVNPDYFWGGRMKLNKEKAITAIRERIARPLGMDVEQAALLIKKVVDANMANVIYRETSLQGYDPGQFVLFAYGGAGAAHCCGYGFQAGVGKIISFPFSPVFSAYGSASMDVVHIYEQSRHVPLMAPGGKKYLTDYSEFNEVVQSLKQKALRDVQGEGFPAEDIVFSLELDLKYGGQIHTHRAAVSRLLLEKEEDAKAIYEQFEKEYEEIYSAFAVYPEGGVDIHGFVLRATVPQPRPELPTHAAKGEQPRRQALKGKRDTYWEEYQGFRQTPIYEQKLLECGNVIEGPAVIEAETTTTVLPPGVRLVVDKFLNLVMEKI